MQASPPLDRVAGRRGAWLGVIAAALSLATQSPWITRPFTLDLEGAVGALYAGAFQKTYERWGFWEIRGAPAIDTIPTDPPTRIVYVRHPPLRDWLIRPFVAVFGLREWSIRALSVLCTMLTAGLLTARAHRSAGLPGVIASIVLVTALPLVFVYGRMPNYEQPVLALGLLAAGMLERPPVRGIRLAGAAALIFLATMTDVAGPLLVAGFFATEWVRRRKFPQLFPFAILAAAAAAGLAAWFLLASAWTGGPAEARAVLEQAVKSTRLAGDYRWWLEVLGGHFLEMLGWTGVALLLASVVWAASRGRRTDPAAAGSILGWTLVGSLNIVLFQNHASAHEFWIYYLLPAVVIGTATLAGKTAARGRLGVAAVAAGLAVTLWVAAVQDARRNVLVDPDALVESAKVFNRIGDEDTLLVLLTPVAHWSRAYYLRPWVTISDGSVASIEGMTESFRAGRIRARRLAVVGSPDGIATLEPVSPELRAHLLAAGFTRTEHVLSQRIPRRDLPLEAFTLAR